MTSRSGRHYQPKYIDKECDELFYLIMEKVDALEAKLNELMAAKADTQGDATSSGVKANGKEVLECSLLAHPFQAGSWAV